MFTRASYLLLALAAILAVPSAPGQPAPRVFYVDQSATGADNGTSWADAKTSLQEALLLASAGGEIWVAAGVYTPDVGFQQTIGDREVSFTLSVGVSLFGGFDGTEVRREERDWNRNVTILSGDLLANDGAVFDPTSPRRDDNSRHVLMVSSSISIPAPVVDGFSIVGGHAAVITNFGGGIAIQSGSHAKLRNLLFKHNYAELCGGGLSSFGTFRLYDSRFSQNAAGVNQSGICPGGNGGGIYHFTDNDNSAELPIVFVEEVIFVDNFTDGGGGAIAVFGGPIAITNSRFVRNRAAFGGAVSILSSPVNRPSFFTNTEFIGNIATNDGGGALFNEKASIVVFNSLFNGNRTESTGSFSFGGAIVLNARAYLSLGSSTFTHNSSPRAGAIFTSISSIEIANSIFWENPTQDGHPLEVELPDSAFVQSSISEGGVPPGYEQVGSGAIDVNPLFIDARGPDNIPGTVDDDLRLSPGSPGIDSGVNSLLPQDLFDLDGDGDLTEPLPVDLDGNIRVRDGGSGFETVDEGAYEFGAVVDAVERLEDESVPGQAECGLSVPFPNPMTERASVEVSTRLSTSVKLSVYDSLGRYILAVYSGFLNPDTRRVFEINGQLLPSGTYHLQLSGSGDIPLCIKAFIVNK